MTANVVRSLLQLARLTVEDRNMDDSSYEERVHLLIKKLFNEVISSSAPAAHAIMMDHLQFLRIGRVRAIDIVPSAGIITEHAQKAAAKGRGRGMQVAGRARVHRLLYSTL